MEAARRRPGTGAAAEGVEAAAAGRIFLAVEEMGGLVGGLR